MPLGSYKSKNQPRFGFVGSIQVVIEELDMNNPSNDIWGSWKMHKLDDQHYYQMGTWQAQPKQTQGWFARFMRAVSEHIITIRCRLDALFNSGYAKMDQQCSCA